MFRMLSQVFSVRIHRPDVHRAVTVRGEINAPVPKHRTSRGIRIILCQRNSLTARRKTPDVLRRPVLISFGKTVLKRKRRDKDGFSSRIEIALASLPQGEDVLCSIKTHLHQLCVRQGRIAIGAIEYAPVTSPPVNQRSAPLPCATRRQPPVDRDGVYLRRAFILGGESNGL